MDARTARDALAAQLLGDVDILITRIAALPDQVATLERSLLATTLALDQGSDRYRMAITAFNDESKKEVTEHLQRIAATTITETTNELATSMKAAAHAAFRTEASDKAAALGIALGQAAREFNRSIWTRISEIAITAVTASATTAAALYFLAHYASR